MWDQRYSVKEYVYGKEANSYFKEQLNRLRPGKILLPGEGEGRNAVFAARKNWKVDAFDTSIEGQKKAFALATEHGVSISYEAASYLGFKYLPEHYDVVALLFTHQPSEMKALFHRKISETLKPGGLLMLEAFHKDQIRRDSGGPKNLDFLYSEDELRKDFSDFEILELKAISRELQEGLFHQGEASVVQFMARKKE